MDSVNRAQYPAFSREGMTLDEFASELSTREGVRLADLEPLTTLLVYTTNSLYRIGVLNGTRILVQGGTFAEITPADFSGSGFGGSLLKCGWIAVGLRMEIRAGNRRFVTSPVRAISMESHASADCPP